MEQSSLIETPAVDVPAVEDDTEVVAATDETTNEATVEATAETEAAPKEAEAEGKEIAREDPAKSRDAKTAKLWGENGEDAVSGANLGVELADPEKGFGYVPTAQEVIEDRTHANAWRVFRGGLNAGQADRVLGTLMFDKNEKGEEVLTPNGANIADVLPSLVGKLPDANKLEIFTPFAEELIGQYAAAIKTKIGERDKFAADSEQHSQADGIANAYAAALQLLERALNRKPTSFEELMGGKWEPKKAEKSQREIELEERAKQLSEKERAQKQAPVQAMVEYLNSEVNAAAREIAEGFLKDIPPALKGTARKELLAGATAGLRSNPTLMREMKSLLMRAARSDRESDWNRYIGAMKANMTRVMRKEAGAKLSQLSEKLASDAAARKVKQETAKKASPKTSATAVVGKPSLGSDKPRPGESPTKFALRRMAELNAATVQ